MQLPFKRGPWFSSSAKDYFDFDLSMLVPMIAFTHLLNIHVYVLNCCVLSSSASYVCSRGKPAVDVTIMNDFQIRSACFMTPIPLVSVCYIACFMTPIPLVSICYIACFTHAWPWAWPNRTQKSSVALIVLRKSHPRARVAHLEKGLRTCCHYSPEHVAVHVIRIRFSRHLRVSIHDGAADKLVICCPL